MARRTIRQKIDQKQHIIGIACECGFPRPRLGFATVRLNRELRNRLEQYPSRLDLALTLPLAAGPRRAGSLMRVALRAHIDVAGEAGPGLSPIQSGRIRL
jgi:hypothetical protein